MGLLRLVGMIHLPAMPGSPASNGMSQREVVETACEDAATLERAGFDAVLVQNSLDRPTRENVAVLTVAQLAAVTTAVTAAVRVAVGVNVVKNDGPAAVAVAAAAGAAFVRVKVLTGAVLSAEGIVRGCAPATQEVRRRAGHDMQVWADVYEPRSRPLLDDDFAAAVEDAFDFGMADAVIVTGRDARSSIELASTVKAAHRRPVVIGGRIDARSVREALGVADAVIVGAALKLDPGMHGRVASTAHALLRRPPTEWRRI